MQLQRQAPQPEDGTFDIYAYCDDDGEPIYLQASHFFFDVMHSDSFMVAELKLQPSVLEVVPAPTRVGSKLSWMLVCKIRHELNNAPDIIPINEAQQQPSSGQDYTDT